ncbi:hypothetical protein JCM10207_005269 [Rhodosporidiobolus poonsookiae]
MHGLHLPRPANPDALPPLASTSSSHSSPPHPPSAPPRAPPPSFAQVRQQARQLRHDNKRSPFISSRTAHRGKDRDLDLLTPEQLAHMLHRTARLLDSPETLANLPGGDARLRSQQQRIQARLKELSDVSAIKSDLEGTHIASAVGGRRKSEGGVGADEQVKKEEEEEDEGPVKDEEDMDGVVETGVADEAASPVAKRRIAAQMFSRSPDSRTSTLSLAESIALQQQAAERDRAALERKQARMEVDSKRKERTGELLRGALGVDTALSEFMLANPDSGSDAEPDDPTIDDWLNEGRRAANGTLDEEEDVQLNPLRAAYMRGWEEAAKEEERAG